MTKEGGMSNPLEDWLGDEESNLSKIDCPFASKCNIYKGFLALGSKAESGKIPDSHTPSAAPNQISEKNAPVKQGTEVNPYHKHLRLIRVRKENE